MHEISVRGVEHDDAEAVFAIASCQRVRHGTLQMPYQSLFATRERLANLKDDVYRLVAEVEGHVVGMAALHLVTAPRRRHVGQIGMMVHDEFQGRGVGTVLLEGLLDLADNWLNLHRVELEVYTDNAPAIHLYQRHGFVIEGTMVEYAFRDGLYIDAYAMGRIRKPTRVLDSDNTDSGIV